ncbi:MAG: hypothetical protein E7440_00330 [Ruminococcaceae bacterium]|nr:hypothetical protein [Oscillospiraceae bacterium]
MDGIEKITARILDDARREADEIAAQAKQKADEIAQRYAKQGDQEAQAILTRGEKAAAERLERLESAAGMERRKMLLAAKQQVLAEAFEKALDDLCALPEQEYINLLAGLALRAARNGREQLIFSVSDRARVGKQVVMAANERLGDSGKLTLSEQTRNIRGGFIMSDGDVEVNCAFETLVRMQRETLEKEVADILFAH